MKIPAGKKVYINYKEPFGPYVLDEEISVSVENQYEPLIKNNPLEGVLELIGSFTNTAPTTGVFGLQVWKGSSPLRLSLNFSFYPNFREGDEGPLKTPEAVYNEVLRFCKATLPPNPGTDPFAIFSQAPGPSIFQQSGSKTTFDKNSVDKTGSFSIKIGSYLYVNPIIITSVSPTFSNEVDTSGYPIWAKLSVEIQSVYAANKDIFTSPKTS